MSRHRWSLLGALVLAATLCAPLATASAQVAKGSRLSLNSQSSWMAGAGTFSLDLAIHSPLPPADLGVQVTVDSQLASRTAFDVSLTGTELPQESCLDRTPLLALTGFSPGVASSGVLALHLPVSLSNTAPSCTPTASGIDLDCAPGACAGVYPARVSLVQVTTHAVLASFTTYLVELNRGGIVPLDVSLVLSLGTNPAIGPNGAAKITSSEVRAISQLVTVLTAYPHLHISLVIYPQLLVALKRDGRTGADLLSRLDTLVASGRRAGSLRLIDAPFVPLDASALAASGLGRELATALQRGEAELDSQFGFSPVSGDYISPGPLDTAGLSLLEQNCIHELVLPETGLASNAIGLTQTAPYVISAEASCRPTSGPPKKVAEVAVGADPAGSLFVHTATNSVLAAHQLLAELAQIYFESPNATPRGVAIAPTSGMLDPKFLRVVLAGLDSRVGPLTATSLSGLFSLPVGSNSNIATKTLSGGPAHSTLPIGDVAKSDHVAAAVRSVVPEDRGLIDTLAQSQLIALAAGLPASERTRYLDAPNSALDDIRSSLSLSGERIVTLTQQSGKIPITIHSTTLGMGTLHVRIALRSPKLSISARSQLITLTSQDYPYRVAVTTRSSGEFSLDIELVTPTGGDLLLESKFAVRSTAVSGVEIGLSVAALVVLLGWWTRSVYRRRKSARPSAPALTASR